MLCFANTIRSFLSSAEKNNLAIIVGLIEWNHTAWFHLKLFSDFISSEMSLSVDQRWDDFVNFFFEVFIQLFSFC